MLEVYLVEENGKDVYLAIPEERRRYIPPGVMIDWEYKGQRPVDDEMFQAVDVEQSLIEFGYVRVPMEGPSTNRLGIMIRRMFCRA